MSIHYVSPSLYGIVHGVHPLAGILLALLDLSTAANSTGRFRDCYLQRNEHGALEIYLLTRNGGGNRPGYAAITNALRAHSSYIRDFDESCDSTYATYVFRVPSHAIQGFEFGIAADPDLIPKSFAERSKTMANRLQDPKDPEAQRITEALRPTMEAINRDQAPYQGLLDADGAPKKL